MHFVSPELSDAHSLASDLQEADELGILENLRAPLKLEITNSWPVVIVRFEPSENA